MKLLFLDIDGVMTTDEGTFNNDKLYSFSSSCVEALNKILSANNVRIILTSSWRTVFDVEKQCRIFKENGVMQLPMGQTKDLGYKHRNLEIKNYLENRKVESFVILDDMQLEGFDDHFVLIDPHKGLSEEYIERINKIITVPLKSKKVL